MVDNNFASKAKVPIKLDKERLLWLNLNAMYDFEEATGQSLFTGENVFSKPTAKTMRVLLWAGLKHEDPELTLEQVGTLIDSGNIGYVVTTLQKAWMIAAPRASKANRPKAQNKAKQ